MTFPGIRFWRRLVQAGVALAFLGIPFLNKAEVNVLSGNFLAFNAAGVPLGDPLAALQVVVGASAAPSSLLLGAGLVLVFALLLGPVFCSWICPYGLFSELARSIRARGKIPPPPQLSVRPFASKVFIVVAGLLLVLLFAPVPLLNQLSLPGWYSRLMQQAVLQGRVLWGGAILLGAALVMEFLPGRRFWCRCLCPQSVLIALFGRFFPGRLRIRFARASCTCPASDRSCQAACSLALDPRKPEYVAQQLQCSNCGDCVDACRSRGRALDFGFGRKQQRNQDTGEFS